jgi:hypothetical protein
VRSYIKTQAATGLHQSMRYQVALPLCASLGVISRQYSRGWPADREALLEAVQHNTGQRNSGTIANQHGVRKINNYVR